MKLLAWRTDDVSGRVQSADGVRLRLAGRLDLLRFALAGNDDEAQLWLGWKRSQILPVESERRVKRLVRGSAGGPPHEEDGSTFLAAFAGQDYVGGVQLGLVSGGDYATIAGAGSLVLGGVVVRALRGRGIGSRMYALGAAYAHEELGARAVVAACPSAHESSRRALLNAGFHPTDGPGEHTLPDGRVLPSVWFVRSW
jgi:RimJ/RimL family protein N-acetyltransferase